MMNKQHLMTILRAPHFSEKSTLGLEKNRQYVFKVLPASNKDEIKQAVELMFNVKVSAVRTVNIKGKSRRFARILGRLKSYKKAYVTLHEGHEIDFSGNAASSPV